MGTKKRKESSGAIDQPLKKSKKSKTSSKKDAFETELKDNATTTEPSKTQNAPFNDKEETPRLDNVAAAKSKKSRKRASDFMNDEEPPVSADTSNKVEEEKSAEEIAEPVKKKSKKSKKNKTNNNGETLTADGVNGVIEHTGAENLETATSHKPVSTSMQAEAERTVDHELEDGFGGFASEDDQDNAAEVEPDDNTAALLAGFDSDTEDKQEDEGLDLGTIPPLPKYKKTQKKLEKAKAKGNDDGPGTVYVGRIPHGFYEKEMRAYFSQFGDISRLRLSRNKRTGASKHFAFIEFASDEVAKIVAETMDNYLMFGHILKCKYAEPGSLHPDVWKGANKKFRKIPHEKLERERLAAPKTEEQWQKIIDKEQRRRDKKATKMKAIGLDMPSSTLTAPAAALSQKLAGQEELKQVENERNVNPAIEPPSDLAEDKVAVDGGKKSKKEKKQKKEKKKNKKGEGDETDIASNSATALKTAETPVESATRKTSSDDEAQLQSANGKSAITSTAPAYKGIETTTKTLSKPERKALKKAKKTAGESAHAPASDIAVAAKEELSADFISFGQFDDGEGNPKASSSPAGANKSKPWKVKKPKEDRKNLVKARGPKSKLVSTKPKPDPNATGKIPGLPLLGKGKDDKATRQAHKEMKKQLLAERAAEGGRRRGSAGAQG
ncbi:hypothetical protein, variant [Cladophialophora immunda]|uniref:RRM domain-containing protein n=1 Tax=Cladophialophora immunda TaxID=569365 RepID=A0A0D2CP98_9EURO|nr:uncharacterized protein PV07_03438 [Cladophialophora immunda]XP_016252062.1 hypothetical protein, variant [Cladophialophora immunda]KIW31845.1 hypothetical protein PV07_03438 [Cladophialophora immunda]KIW31846.1 hypothetical protein, variant [Cladophialophora immunda]OQU98441.1 RNA recognition motif aka RRM, RBD, or RNP domain-containing protein isoform 1 [Cladophialophora immunda]OQU98442.1 RNA recognition motif aka RRM, RBD, or RNP domain-containing protein isoform 2 [Cladophialophora imm